jgi:glycosyltransferase involved in cell wall biosynthesis
MNILHISVRADFGGGPEHMFQQITDQIDRHGISVFLACPKDYPYYDQYCHAVGQENVLLIPHRKFNIFRSLALLKYVYSNKIDIIHSHGKGAGIYGRFLRIFSGIPCVHTFHGLHVGEYTKLKKRIYIGLERFLGVFTKQVICVSDGELRSIRSDR